MNANAKRWVEALRSGEYAQTENVLRSGDSFCCLGVACNLYDPALWDREPTPDSFVSYQGAVTELPESVRKWLGLQDSDGAFGLPCTPNGTLAEENDSGRTFEEIAAIIEREPEGLFA